MTKHPVPQRGGPTAAPAGRGRIGWRRGALLAAAAAALAAASSLLPVAAQAARAGLARAAAAGETQLSESGWTASSNTNSAPADAPANAIDGNTSTRFSSDAYQAAGQWFQVNLGSAQTFNQIEMDSGGYGGDYARGYNVEVSSNGSTFTSVATGTGTSSPETVTFTAQTAQYIRVVLTASSSTNWWSIVEFTAYTNGSGGG
ncbi:MAG: discoidin domain-containing protein, partial [Streptosporangiales bacterium]